MASQSLAVKMASLALCIAWLPVKTLLVLRHASAAARGPDGMDFSRPLSPLGEREARIQGAFLREAGILPERVVTSAAMRAASTTDLLVEAIGHELIVDREETLYNAPGELLLDYVQRLPDHLRTVLMVAHMPGVAELVWLLASEPETLNLNFPACTLVAISVGTAMRWSEVVSGCGTVEWVLPPLLPT